MASTGARVKEFQRLPGWLALWVSVSFHAIVLGYAVWIGDGGSPLGGGEGGLAGAGGDTIEVSVIEGRLLPPIEDRSEAATDREPAIEERAQARPVIAARERGQRAIEREQERTIERGAPSAEMVSSVPAATGRSQSGGAEGAAERPESGGAEGGAERSESGRAAGDSEAAAVILGSVGLGSGGPGARALLERALACGDPIEGVWVAHRYSPEFHDWARMTLRIEREGERLSGTIRSRAWSGLATDRRPPQSCAADAHDVTVRMLARGWIRGEHISFGADTHEIERTDCASSFFAYNPDHFTGRLDSLREEIDALNNDGGRDVNAPYRFRRVACLEPEPR